MSVTAVGPATDLNGPLPVAPPHSLLNTEGVVVARDATRVLNGVNVWSYPSGGPDLWEPCATGTFRTKSEASEQITERFDAFVVYKAIACSAIGLGFDDIDELAGRAIAVLEATESAGVEEALAAGVSQSGNPFFGDANVSVLNSGTAVSPSVGMSFLEEAIGNTGRKGMIHATPAVIAGLLAIPFDLEGGDMSLQTANGTPIVSGMGYQGVDTPFLASPGATQDWVFATGGVQVYLGPVVITDTRETLDRSDNSLVFRAERYVLAIWDTVDTDDDLVAAAVLVDWAT